MARTPAVTSATPPASPRRALLAVAAGIFAAWTGTAALAANGCPPAPPFATWLEGVRAEARADGIPESAVDAATANVHFEPDIIRHDRGQTFFSQTFSQVADRMLGGGRIPGGLQRLKANAALFQRIKAQFGTAPEVITAVWSLESGFGTDSGKLPTLVSLATLAYDCRRSEKFRAEFIDAMQVIAHGDLTPDQMRGAWAGELGQTQFMPSNYIKYGIDFDGDGQVDLIRSVPDVLASTGNFLEQLGWQRGQPWLEEVHLPANFPWAEADLSVVHTRAQWAQLGVQRAGGMPHDNVPVSVFLPEGRFGPAFLAYHNFSVMLGWNDSLTYTTVVGYYAMRLAGAPAIQPGHAVALSAPDMKELQQRFRRAGYDVGDPDGKLGTKTRIAARALQLKFGLPPDSWPDAALLNAMRSRG